MTTALTVAVDDLKVARPERVRAPSSYVPVPVRVEGASPWTVLRWAGYAVLAALLWQVWPQPIGGPVAYVSVSGTSMEPGLHTGDLVVVRRRSSYAVGDVVAYRVPNGQFGERNVVIHRLTAGDGRRGWTTRGDNRTAVDPWTPRDSDIVGEMTWTTASGGEIFARLGQPLPLGLLCGGLTTLVLVLPDRRRRAAAPAPVIPMVLSGLRMVPAVKPDRGGGVIVNYLPAASRASCVAVPGMRALPQRRQPGVVTIRTVPRSATAASSHLV